MAVDMFIKFTGGDVPIKGEAQDSTHKEEVDVLAWSWGMSNSGTTHMGGGGGSGKVNVQDLSFTKYVDFASTSLMLACCNGAHIGEAMLVVRKAGTNPVEYIKIKMTDVLVTAVSTGGSGGEDRLTENVTLNFATVGVDYQGQAKDGKADSKLKASMTWKIAENVA